MKIHHKGVGETDNNNIWFKKPADRWEEAFPIGNGRLGAMVYGSVSEETIRLNEDSIWYGTHKERDNPDAHKYLKDIKKLLFEGRITEAEFLARMAMTSNPKYFQPYLPLGNLNMYFSRDDDRYENYQRQLDINTGITTVQYNSSGAHYRREIFCSSVDQLIILHLTCDKSHRLSFASNLSRRPYDVTTEALGEDSIVMSGTCGDHGIEFSCLLKAIAENGSTKTIGDFLSIEAADSVTLFLAVGSTFRNENPLEMCKHQIDEALATDYKTLKDRHIKEHKRLFGRVDISLSDAGKDFSTIPTDERLERVRNGADDHQLMALYFQYGRYLLMSCSRPGSLPANLQGIWNDSFQPPWESKYTININTEMNYWPAEICNLSECHFPLFDLLERMLENGKKTAKKIYNCNGFVAHLNTNIWGDTAIDGIYMPAAIWPMGGAWLSLHLWEHYEFSLDVDFLARRAYPILKEAAIFFLEYLTIDSDGKLVTGPSLSPENSYRLPNGQTGNLCMGPEMDIQIVRALFSVCIKAANLLRRDKQLIIRIGEACCKLPDTQIGKQGQIMEWAKDLDEIEPGHRHFSHLFALYPGEQINRVHTPALANAAGNTLKRRFENGNGGYCAWSLAWATNLWARLGDGEQAYNCLKKVMEMYTANNLLSLHPPRLFQIDGNFGSAAGMAEMLLQSHNGEIQLLPALPKAWKDGHIKGICARGGFEVEIIWKDNKLYKAMLISKEGNTCRIRTRDNITVKCGDATISMSSPGGISKRV